jgi:hypothetical protein
MYSGPIGGELLRVLLTSCECGVDEQSGDAAGDTKSGGLKVGPIGGEGVAVGTVVADGFDGEGLGFDLGFEGVVEEEVVVVVADDGRSLSMVVL